MSKANFAVIDFDEHLGNDESDLKTDKYTFVGNQTTTKEFFVEVEPEGEGYILVHAGGVQNALHKVVINGKNLRGVDIEAAGRYRWNTNADRVNNGILQQGNNTIQIKRARGGDNFLLAFVTVHWNEKV